MAAMVRLQYATAQAFSVGGVSYSYLYAKVKVKNIAYHKEVVVHYNSYGGWLDQALSWQTNYGNYDIFQDNVANTSEFVIRYTSDGATYWDNNFGANYTISNFRNVVGGNVMLNQATARIGMEAGGGFTFTTSWIEGNIYVNNLSYNKQVGIRFSADGGVNWENSNGSYQGLITEGTYATTLGAEVWHFKTPTYNYNAASNVFLFAVYYHNLDSGQWYWDTNFGQNYMLNKAEGSMIQ